MSGRTCVRGAFVLRLVCAMCSLMLLYGCGLLADEVQRPEDGKDEKNEERVEKPDTQENPLPYSVRFVVLAGDGSEATDGMESASGSGTSGSSGGADDSGAQKADGNGEAKADGAATKAAEEPAVDKDTAAYFVKRMKGLSELIRLRDSLPDGETGLEMRARKDVETALKLMGSEGYYDGTADLDVSIEDGRGKVVITMMPGQRYVVGDIEVNYLPALDLPPGLKDVSEAVFPRTSLPGVTAGRPITAGAMLKSVDSIPHTLQRNAFPRARLGRASFYLNRENRTLNAIIDIIPGRPATIGAPVFKGESTVKADYLARMADWEPGVTLWNQDIVDDYVSKLRSTGLFRKVAAADPPRDCDGTGPAREDLDITLEDSAHRSLSATLQYSTDSGFGVSPEWEHRNILGRGEKLNLQGTYSTLERGVNADFTKPWFFSEANTLHIWGEAVEETTDAYDRVGTRINAAILRRWSSIFTTETGPFADGGWLKNNDVDQEPYTVVGGALRGTLDTRDNAMNPTGGNVVQLTASPMTGSYNGDFNALSTELRLAGYWAPFTNAKGDKDDSLVLAARVSLASITGASLDNLPSTYRYYLGGADSVRGYGYQQIGPMDKSGDPVGGRSYQTVNLESRFKVTDDLGFVVFLDGGSLYKDEMPQFETDMDWGAGAGIRYYTPIGPLRFDVAVPVNNDVDPPLQIYISIGQAF